MFLNPVLSSSFHMLSKPSQSRKNKIIKTRDACDGLVTAYDRKGEFWYLGPRLSRAKNILSKNQTCKEKENKKETNAQRRAGKPILVSRFCHLFSPLCVSFCLFLCMVFYIFFAHIGEVQTRFYTKLKEMKKSLMVERKSWKVNPPSTTSYLAQKEGGEKDMMLRLMVSG